jgi:hypothetical protein
MAYEHLKFSREVPIPERHKTAAKFQRFRPENPRAYGADLRRTFDAAKQSAIDELAGYDDRILFKVQLRDDAAVPELGDIPGVELVSQEDKSIVLALRILMGWQILRTGFPAWHAMGRRHAPSCSTRYKASITGHQKTVKVPHSDNRGFPM